jgi:acyl-CoA thioesterase II
MTNFVDATHVEGGAGRYAARLDPDWFAWGPFGGYLAALAVRAIARESRVPWPATFSGSFLSVGEVGPIEIQVEVRKRGKRAELLRAILIQGDNALFEASMWLIERDLEGLQHDHARMPEVPTCQSLPSFAQLSDQYDSWYPFWKHIEGRPVAWYDPDDRQTVKPHWDCWLRLNTPAEPDSPALRAATAAMWLDFPAWNAAAHAHPWPLTHIAPTLELTVQFHSALYACPRAPDWVLVDGACPTAASGLVGGTASLWSAEGRMLALCTTQMLCRPNPTYSQELQEVEQRRAARRR